jgi:hypothetical protein
MRGKVYTANDIRRAIQAAAVYSSDLGPDGELPPVLDKDLLIFARTALQILSTGPDNDRRWRVSHDWRRRLELIGLDPTTFAITDAKEFEATVNLMNFTRKQREQAKDKRRKLRGPTKGFYAKGERGSVPYIPPAPSPESTNSAAFPCQGTSDNGAVTGQASNFYIDVSNQLRQAKEDAKDELARQRNNGW